MSRTVAADLSASSSIKRAEAIAAIKRRASLIADFKNGEYKLYTPEAGLADTDFATMFSFTRATVATVDTFAGVADIVSGDPRFSAGKGLRIEESRENLLTYSEEFDNADWSKVSAGTGSVPVVTANAGDAPDGSTTADRVELDLGGGTTTSDASRLRQNATTGAESVLSVYLKSFDGENYVVSMNNGATTESKLVTSEWARFDVYTSATGSLALDIQIRGGQTAQNSDTADLLVWGAQLEEGSFITSYIPTAASSVVRDAEDCSRTLGQEFNAEAFTAFVSFLAPPITVGSKAQIALSDGTSDNAIFIRADSSSGLITCIVFVGAVAVFNQSYTTAYSEGDLIKAAVSLDGSNTIFYVNGVVADTQNASGGGVPDLSTLLIGSNEGNTQYAVNTIQDARIFPEPLTADELVTLTEPD